MNRIFLFLIAFILFASTAQAQDDFEKFRQQYKSEFQEYKDKRDAEFAKLLKEAWQFVKENDGVKAYSEPKVVEPPKMEPKPVSQPNTQPKKVIEIIAPKAEDLPPPPMPKPEPKKEEKEQKSPAPQPKVDKKPEPKPEPQEKPKSDPRFEFEPPTPPAQKQTPEPPKLPFVSASYFNVSAKFSIDPKMKEAAISEYKAPEIAKYWDNMSKTNYEPLIAQIKQRQSDEELNDWAVGYMLESLAKEIYGANESNQALFLWFAFNKLGYAAKVGYNKTGVYLMAPTDFRLFGIKYFMIDNERYYVLRFTELGLDAGALYTYKGNYPESTEKIRFAMYTYPKMPEKLKERQLSFAYNNEKYSFTVTYNEAILDFFNVYPQADLPVYFRAPASSSATLSMINGLKPIIQGKSEWESINIILRFVQSAFEYKTDDDQFGREKYFFVEETLGYPFSDCEDRSIMFAYLVNALTGNEVVGLKYPGHLATAVKFKDAVGGDQLNFQGTTYTVCDPTYVNADIGMSMPQFKGKPATIVKFR